ncbi:response regulator transcription factor [Pseudomonas savastanoi]|uniref:response regulator transcription factor n=1 Tax=Pseudomonas savastanoi TaxID=29438 RepID=UPI000F002F58|nr:LuxR C-terminal-related transcriptional regulator [Pseudomonas savastanoi]RMN59556.1 LuxR family transcriptional regulator [Pseudomonas savastanoi pv. savastanoi]
MTTNTLTVGTWQGHLKMGLAPRELEATLWAAADMTVKEIGRAMGISPATAEKRLDSARFKFGAKTMRGLVLEAFRRGVISPAAALTLVLAAHGAIASEPMTKVRRSGGSESKIESRIAARRVEISLAA